MFDVHKVTWRSLDQFEGNIFVCRMKLKINVIDFLMQYNCVPFLTFFHFLFNRRVCQISSCNFVCTFLLYDSNWCWLSVCLLFVCLYVNFLIYVNNFAPLKSLSKGQKSLHWFWIWKRALQIQIPNSTR